MSITFTESEIKMLSRAWLCVEGGMPKIDHDKLAKQCGFTVGSAKVLWGKLRRKLEAANEKGASVEGGASPEKKTPKKRGRRSKAEIAAAKEPAEALEEDLGMKVKEEGGEEGGELLAGMKEYVEKKEGGSVAGAGTGLIGAESDDEV